MQPTLVQVPEKRPVLARFCRLTTSGLVTDVSARTVQTASWLGESVRVAGVQLTDTCGGAAGPVSCSVATAVLQALLTKPGTVVWSYLGHSW